MNLENSLVATFIVLLVSFIGYKALHEMSKDLKPFGKVLWWTFWALLILVGIASSIYMDK